VATRLQAKQFWKTGVAWFAAVGLASGAGIVAEDGEWDQALLLLVGALVVGALAALAFRSEAARAVGPADGPERAERRLGPTELRFRLGIGLAVGVLFALGLHLMSSTGDDATAVTFVNRTLFMALVYGAYLVWQAWAAPPGEGAGEGVTER